MTRTYPEGRGGQAPTDFACRDRAGQGGGTSSSRRLLTQDRNTTHQASLGRGEVGTCVQRAAIVPHQEIADAPDVFVDELLLFLVIEQEI